MRPRRTLTATISEKAIATYTGVVTLETFTKWEQHWIDTAKQWRNELATEGLVETCKQIDDIIAWNERNRLMRELRDLHGSKT